MENKIGIYKITNTANRKVYIGQSTNIHKRFLRHKRDLERGVSPCKELQHDYDENPQSMVFDILCECAVDDLDSLEIKYIQEYDSMNPEKGYNRRLWGNWMTRNVSEETREKLSYLNSGERHPHYGKKTPPEVLKKMSDSMKVHSKEISERMTGLFAGEKHPMYGKHHTEEAKRKMSEAKRGRKPWIAGKKHKPESLKKLSENRKGKAMGENNKMSKAVICVETGETYESQRIASRATGIRQSDISRSCIRGSQTHGVHFRFAGDSGCVVGMGAEE